MQKFAAALVLVLLSAPSVLGAGGLGSIQDISEANGEIQKLIEPFRAKAQEKAQALGWNGIFDKWEAQSFATQVVAGTNYFVKVGVSASHAVHLRIFQPLPHTREAPKLHAVRVRPQSQPLDYFTGDKVEL
eukprot:TRINITY_DN45834_c0_g1_i1.p2 TRINITY_DN45834_c0_g1~~TRINITY_DN45834_c0_g1_i1.p2  ORF type:complete len:131 (-),score=45.54 TRINITY_DN45834_c0_g1_i1:106-498(-)